MSTATTARMIAPTGTPMTRQIRRAAPAMPNGRCRMHGGKSPGAPRGNGNARKHGLYTAEAIAHLNCLIERGRIVRETDAAGVWTYRRARLAASAA